MSASITVHNIQTGSHEYADLDALILGACEFYDENQDGGGYIQVRKNDKVITLAFIHDRDQGCDFDSSAVIVLADLPESVDADDLYELLKSCC